MNGSSRDVINPTPPIVLSQPSQTEKTLKTTQ
jgi:hypothetical protein